MKKKIKNIAIYLLLIVFSYCSISILTYQLMHPELTQTQAFLMIPKILIYWFK